VAKIISLFNHKGGVSKTTTVFNLGWMLARKGNRVLVVDCDPQCNLTGMILGFSHQESATSIEGGKGDAPLNIRDALAPAFESRPALVKPVKCVAVPGNDQMFLLPGHIGLSEYEVTLGIAQELSGSLVTLRNLPGAMHYAITITAKKYKIDLVLVDMSPSLGPLNQNLLTTSDFFIIPMHPDFFSIMAIKSLSSVIPKWKSWADAAKNLPLLKAAEYPFPNTSPKFLGYVIQKYRPRGGAAPSKAFQQWIDEIEQDVGKTLLPVLHHSGMMLSDKAYRDAGFAPREPLLQMPDFNALIARSQEHQVPIFELTDAQLHQAGVVLERTKESMNRFKELFSAAADKVIKLTR
jgi:cellulose biosynthesis protein BcsQ